MSTNETIRTALLIDDEAVSAGYGLASLSYSDYRERGGNDQEKMALDLAQVITATVISGPIKESASFILGVCRLFAEVAKTEASPSDEILQKAIAVRIAKLKRRAAAADLSEAYAKWRSTYGIYDRLEQDDPRWELLTEATRPQYIAREDAKQAERNAQRRLDSALNRLALGGRS